MYKKCRNCNCGNDTPRWFINSLWGLMGLCIVGIIVCLVWSWYLDPDHLWTNIVRGACYYSPGCK